MGGVEETETETNEEERRKKEGRKMEKQKCSKGGKGTRCKSSAKMQPTAQRSMPVEYCVAPNSSSGARYQRVQT